MAETTYTRQVLRRAIGKANGMLFYRIYDSSVQLTGTPTAGVITASSLKQATDTWKNAYAYVASGTGIGQFRRITASSTAGALTLEYDLTTIPVAGDQIEILDWSPALVHEAIDRAIEEGFSAFPSVKEDETLVVLEDTVEYSLSALSPSIWLPIQVWMERSPNNITGEASSATASTLTDNNAGWTVNEHAGKKVSIYDGTGKQQIRTVASNTTDTLTISVNWVTTPDATSKYTLWDANEQEEEWYRLTAGGFDKEEFPDKLRLTKRYPEFYGLRFRFVFLAGPSSLSSDTSTTTVNREYIVYQASAILHDMLVPDSSVNRSAHASIAEYMSRIARAVKEEKRRIVPRFNVWVEDDPAAGLFLPDNILWSD